MSLRRHIREQKKKWKWLLNDAFGDLPDMFRKYNRVIMYASSVTVFGIAGSWVMSHISLTWFIHLAISYWLAMVITFLTLRKAEERIHELEERLENESR